MGRKQNIYKFSLSEDENSNCDPQLEVSVVEDDGIPFSDLTDSEKQIAKGKKFFRFSVDPEKYNCCIVSGDDATTKDMIKSVGRVILMVYSAFSQDPDYGSESQAEAYRNRLIKMLCDEEFWKMAEMDDYTATK